MLAFVAVLVLGLLAYVPGRSLLRALAPGGRGGERVLFELLLGNAALGLLGFALGELGFFSLLGVVAGLALIAVLATLAAGAGVAAASAESGFGAGAAAAILALALAWVMPPFDSTLYGHDSSVYVASGRYLADHGSIAISDPTIEAMPMATRVQLFPSYGREPGEPPFVRLAGGLLLPDLDRAVVLPAFHHILAVWVGLAYAVGGDAAVTAPAAYFAALAVLALAAFTRRLGGAAGVIALLGLALWSVPQYWYSRFLMPEVPSQFFLWGGLAAAGASFERPRQGLGIVAGLGLGMAGLLRVDGLAHLAAALALWLVFVPDRWPATRGFAPALILLALYAVVHQVFFPTHYLGEVVGLLRYFGASLAGLGWAAAPLGLVLLATAAGARALGGARNLLVRLGAGAAFVAYVAISFGYTRPDWGTVFGWLATYAGVPLLLAGGAGAFLWARRAPTPAERFALLLGLLVLAQVAYDPRVTPAPLWAIRRFVPVALPTLLIAAALCFDSLWARGRRLVAAALVTVIALGAGGSTVLAYRTSAFEEASVHVRAIAATLPDDAVVILEPDFAIASQLHIALWTATGHPTYLLVPQMDESLTVLLQALGDRPVYWIGADDPATMALVARIGTATTAYRFALATRRMGWYEPRDDLGVRQVTVSTYRLHARPAPAGSAARDSKPPALQ